MDFWCLNYKINISILLNPKRLVYLLARSFKRAKLLEIMDSYFEEHQLPVLKVLSRMGVNCIRLAAAKGRHLAFSSFKGFFSLCWEKWSSDLNGEKGNESSKDQLPFFLLPSTRDFYTHCLFTGLTFHPSSYICSLSLVLKTLPCVHSDCLPMYISPGYCQTSKS